MTEGDPKTSPVEASADSAGTSSALTHEWIPVDLRTGGVSLWQWDVVGDEVVLMGDARLVDGSLAVPSAPIAVSHWDANIHPDDQQAVQQARQGLLIATAATAYQVEQRRRSSGGRWRWFLERGQVVARTDAGKAQQVAGVHVDITDDKLADDALRESEARLRTVFANAAIGMAMVDANGEGTLVETNRALEEMLEYEEGELIGRTFHEVTHPADIEVSQRLYQIVLGGETSSFRIEKRYLRKSGETVWGRATISLVRDSLGRPAYVIAVIEDIAIRKQAEQELGREQRTLRQLLDLQDRERRLTAYEIHDGFVQDIIGMQMLLESFHNRLQGKHPEIAEELDPLRRLTSKAIDEGRRLISDLRPLVIDEMGLVEALNYLSEEEQATGALQVVFTHEIQFERLPTLVEGTIYRIVQEALNNVRRHSGSDRATIHLSQSKRRLRLEIADQGKGFDPQQVPRTRFGLAGIQERARVFGGTATIESSPGAGTRLRIELPLDLLDRFE